jgi:hypothetical protein
MGFHCHIGRWREGMNGGRSRAARGGWYNF